jgi:hypothetical protein
MLNIVHLLLLKKIHEFNTVNKKECKEDENLASKRNEVGGD